MEKKTLEFEEGTTLSDIVKYLNIDEEVSILLLNGIDGLLVEPKDGDIVSLFPPVGGG